MTLTEIIERSYNFIGAVIKEIERSKIKKQRDREIAATEKINECAGELAVCKSNFETVIRVQSKSVRDARECGFPETMQKEAVINASVGYLLVKEAIFALSTLRSFKSLEIAYGLLNSASYAVAGNRESFKESLNELKKRRPEFEKIFEKDSVDDKFKTVEVIIEDIIATGSIEESMRHAVEKMNRLKSFEEEMPHDLPHDHHVSPPPETSCDIDFADDDVVSPTDVFK